MSISMLVMAGPTMERKMQEVAEILTFMPAMVAMAAQWILVA